jgi:glycosyltransferase involved in cell wall biosynthesis
MRVLALVPSLYDTSPGQRYRIEQWTPLLNRSGVEITFAPFECAELNRRLHEPGGMVPKAWLIAKAFWRRAQTLARVRDYDVCYIFREAALLGPPLFEYWVRRAGVPVIFDFDDAIFVPYVSPSNGYLSYLKFPAKTRSICRISTAVIAGNPYLAEYARQVNDNVTVVPTTMDTKKYQCRRQPPGTPPVIGWTGSFSTVQHLNMLRTALQRLARHSRFKLRVIGAPQYRLEGVEVEALPWRAASEVDDLSVLDIGIMPLPDDRWSRGKCACKALQYMAAGIPAICSPVGVNSDIIRDGENGLLAASEDEWVEKLLFLLRSAEVRHRLGAAGRATVEEKYSAIVQAPRVQEVIRGAAASERSH